MLFRTVYGPELEAIYYFIVKADVPLSRQAIHAAFIPQRPKGEPVSTQNVDDALSFLESARLIESNGSGYRVLDPAAKKPFQIRTLRQLRKLELDQIEPVQPTDPLYMLILTELFIRPNQFLVEDVHHEANKLRRIADAGGLSREKLQAWKRVMEFLGVGQRVLSGFRCAYSPSLLLAILDQWPQPEGVLQIFFEEHLDYILPFQTENGDLAHAVEAPLDYLTDQGLIALNPLPDSPNKPYFGERSLKHIARLEVSDAV
jgi:hypothetical protein